MAAPKKYGDDLRAAVHELINEQGRPATQIAPLLKAKGFSQIPPVDTMRDWAKASRIDITGRPKTDQLRELTGLAVRVIHDGFTRQQAKSDDADPDDTLKLVRSLRELEPLLTDKPQEKGATERKGTLGGLTVVPNADASANTDQPQAAPVTARATSG